MNNQRNWSLEILDIYREDPSESLSFLTKGFGSMKPGRFDYFKWYCIDNPAGRAVIPILRDPSSDKIVGMCWFIPLFAQVDGQECLGATGVNIVIHRDYRGKHLIRKVVHHGDKEMKARGVDFCVVIPNEKSTKAMPYINREMIGPQDLMVRPINWSFLENVLKDKFGFILSPLRSLAKFLWPIIIRPKKIVSYGNSYIIEPTSTFSPAFDTFWDRVKDKYPAMYKRNKSILDWRFIEHPTYKYTIYTAWHDEDVIGYIVCRVGEIRELTAGFIVDYLIEASKRGCQAGELLIAKAVKFFHARQVGLVICLAQSYSQEGRTLQRQGFITLPQRLNPLPLVTYQIVYSNKVNKSSVANNQNWFFQLGDFDYV